MKSIILARVSTDEQDSNSAQISRLKKYVETKGFKNPEICEIKESSSKEYRYKFQEIINNIKNSNEPMALFVDTVDRLQRSFKESVLLDEMRREGKVELHFYREGLRIHKDSNSSDIMRWDMAVMFAKMYVLQLSDNVKRALDKKVENGEWTGSAPFGYQNVSLDKEKRLRKDIIHDPESADTVVEIYNKYASGEYSARRIANELKERGVTTRNGNNVVQSHVHAILCNPFYYGRARSKKHGEYDHIYKPIVSKELWDKVREIREKRNRNPVKTISKDFIFRGLLVCPNCGCSITAETAKGKYIYYSCTNAKRVCKREYVNEEVLLKPVREVLRSISITDEVVDKIVTFLKEDHEYQSEHHKKEIIQLRAKYDTTQKKVERLLNLLVDETITKEGYQTQLDGYKEKQDEINARLKCLTQDDKDYHITAKTVLSLAQRAEEIFNSSEVAEKRQLLKFLFQNLCIKEKRLVYRLNSPFDTLVGLNSSNLLRRQDSNLRQID